MERSLEIQLTVHGIKLEQAYEGQLFAVKKWPDIPAGKPVPDCVQFDYKVSVKADPSVCEQQYINRIVPREVDLFLQSLSLLLRRPSQLIVYKAKLDGVAAEPKVQQYAPNLYNLAEMLNRGKFTPSGLSTCPSRDFWGLLENTISSYRQRTDDVSRRVTLALRWFKKGSDELNSSDRLVAFWISFNALYEDPLYSQQKSIANYIELVDSVMAQRYVTDNMTLLKALSGFPIELRQGKKATKPVAKELACLLSAGQLDYAAVAGKAALVIYGIRNKLFHGEYDPDSEDHQKPIATAEDLLSSLVRELIVKEMTEKPLPATKNVLTQYFERPEMQIREQTW